MSSYDKVTNYYKTSGSSTYSKTKPVTEYGVSLDDYTSNKWTRGTSDSTSYLKTANSYSTIDVDGYKAAQLSWMKGNSAFDGWTDSDMQSFLDSVNANNWSTKQANAAQMYQSYQIGVRNSNADKAAAKADMLAEIEAYKAGYSNEAIATAVAQEQQALNLKIQETLENAVNQAAAQGRVIDNTTYAMLRGRLEAQAANVLQQTQMQYEQKRQEYAYQAMQMKNDVYKNSGDTMMSVQDLQSIISAMAGK